MFCYILFVRYIIKDYISLKYFSVPLRFDKEGEVVLSVLCWHNALLLDRHIVGSHEFQSMFRFPVNSKNVVDALHFILTAATHRNRIRGCIQ